MKKLICVFACAAICVFSAALIPQKTNGKSGKLIETAGAIPNRYIVLLDEKFLTAGPTSEITRTTSENLAAVYGGSIDKIFSSAVKGFSIEMS